MDSSSGGQIVVVRKSEERSLPQPAAKKKPSYFCMVQPPLTKQLKGILSEYPDGGQILKELIQNADDAGASEMKILLDSRRINRSLTTSSPHFTKFFQAPALCVYNDAEFTEDDWRDICMMYSSVKENDRLKVGRFGLGFKSVFHITDHPCIISGDTILLMDPQQPADEVNAKIQIKELNEIEGMDIGDFFDALDGQFGINQAEFVQSGYFKGTLFWFSLREVKTDLSANTYDDNKVLNLFNSFQSEASSILLFLKHLSSIRIELSTVPTKNEPIVHVWIKNGPEIRKENDTVFSILQTLDITHDDVYYAVQMEVVVDIGREKRQQITEWLVVNCAICKSATDPFKKLIQSKTLGLSPCVGIAVPLNRAKPIDGHIFCFLPLPKEGSKLTGLPFHVNGHFALSQNRHHLKWATDDQKHEYVNDEILWNERMLAEALPLAFDLLFDQAIELAKNSSNTALAVGSVQAIIPNIEIVGDKNWKEFVNCALDRRVHKPLVYCRYSDTWVQLSDAVFTTFGDLPNLNEDLKTAIRNIIGIIGLHPVEIPECLFGTLQLMFPSEIIDITPKLLNGYLRINQMYLKLTDAQKHCLVVYLTSDKDVKKLEGLYLLMLASGTWTQFRSTGERLYWGTNEELKMFPGLESRFTAPLGSHNTMTARTLESVLTEQYFAVHRLDNDSIRHLLTETVLRHLGESLLIYNNSTLTVDWLRCVWTVITQRGIRNFADLPLFPIVQRGTFESVGEIKLIDLYQPLIFKECPRGFGSDALNTDLESCLRKLHVTVIAALPSWITFEVIQNYVVIPSLEGIQRLLENQAKHTDHETIHLFNNNITLAEKYEFLKFLSKLNTLGDNTKKMLSQLKLFSARKNVRSIECPVNAEGKTHFIRKNDLSLFPEDIEFPQTCIVVGEIEEAVARNMSFEKMSLMAFMKMKLQHVKLSEKYRLILFFLDNFEKLKDLVDVVRAIPFITTTADKEVRVADVFDPYDPSLIQLFRDENVFPKQVDQWRRYRKPLELLGMKGKMNVSADNIYIIAKNIDRKKQMKDVCDQSKALQEYIEQYPHILDQPFGHGKILGQAIAELSCFLYCSRERLSEMHISIPGRMALFSDSSIVVPPNAIKSVSFWQLVCSSMPMNDSTSKVLSSYYGWNDKPSANYILDHLKNIKNANLTAAERVVFIPILYSVYQSLAEEMTFEIREAIVCNALVWTDETFAPPSNVIVNYNKDELRLEPYFNFLAMELKTLKQFFIELGCFPCQDEYVLANALRRIRERYSTESCTDGNFIERDVQRDFRYSLQIINRLAEKDVDKEWAKENVLIVVQSNTDDTITFAPLVQCVYDDDPLCTNDVIEPNVFFVHSDIPYTTAESLGIKSVNRRALMDADDFEEWGQKENFTTRIRNLLNDAYTDGIAVVKELLQNADDAGARKLCFVYDQRKNLDCRARLISRKLNDFQGEALWCYNDKVFTDQDLTNITQFNSSLKKSDTSSIGKFGLGFTAVYNLTDVPSFISGDYMVIFDPHEKYLDSNASKTTRGKRVPLFKRTLVKRHEDQFKPFEGLFDCCVTMDPFKLFPGTLFRFPFRTPKQAEASEISKNVYNHEDVKELLQILIKNADMLLLFCQNVSSIQILHLPADARPSDGLQEIFCIHKDTSIPSVSSISQIETCVLQQAAHVCESNEKQDLYEIHEVTFKHSIAKGTELLQQRFGSVCPNATWLITWFMSGDIERFDRTFVPLVAIATPCRSKGDWSPQCLSNVHNGNYKSGHIFCFLPLPIQTELPFHINGCFQISSDRRTLAHFTEDDKIEGLNQKRGSWNNDLLKSSLVQALMKHISITNTDCENEYILWPNLTSEIVHPLVCNFYRFLIDSNISIFKDNETFVKFSELLVLDNRILSDPDVGDFAFDFIKAVRIDNSKIVMNIPDNVLRNIRSFNEDRTRMVEGVLIQMHQLLVHFLKHVSNEYWAKERLAQSRFLRRSILCDDQRIYKMMQNSCFVPTEPMWKLRKIQELINPTSNLALMFTDSDERFIWNNDSLRDKKVLLKLVELGMITENLPADLLINRCESVQEIAHHCNECARIRLKQILSYLSYGKVDISVFGKLQNIHFLPVLLRPAEWNFTWYADSLTYCPSVNCTAHDYLISGPLLLGTPESLLRTDCRYCVGSVQPILDESDHMDTKVFKKLGVARHDQLTIPMLMAQLDIIANEYDTHRDSKNMEIQKLLDGVYNFLDTLTINLSKTEQKCQIRDMFTSTIVKPIIDVGHDMVSPYKVAKYMIKSCSPDLHVLPSNLSPARVRVFEIFGVKDHFSCVDIINVFIQKTEQCSKLISITNVIDLLANLAWCMDQEEISYDQLQDFKEYIIAPDTEGQFWPTYTLALDDVNMPSQAKLRLLHGDIPPNIGKVVGVKSKPVQILKLKSKVIPFGQRESLITRLNGLLKDYPCDASIMKELIQNADDARASEIRFIKYFEQKPIKGCLEKGDNLHPALCVFNDSYFTDNDFEGIKNLGIGSKADDPSKTGQFGLGFNAVYHITDTPSFLTKGPGLCELGHVGVFDPLLTTIGEISEGEPGIRYDVKDLLEDFPDIAAGYPDFKGERGTMFWLPLRTKKSAISSYCSSQECMDKMLDDFVQTMPEMLLFLKHLKTIKLMQYENNVYKEIYSIQSELDEEEDIRRLIFFEQIQEKRVMISSQNANTIEEKPISVSYKMQIRDNKGDTSLWLIVHQFWASDLSLVKNISTLVSKYNLRLSPLGGVCVKLCHKNTVEYSGEKERRNMCNSVQGKSYCILPLCGTTGLPFHVNGHFAVDRGRRRIWDEDRGYRKDWNEFLLSAVIPESLCIALKFLQSYFVNRHMPVLHKQALKEKCLKQYFSYFPKNRLTHDFWKTLVDNFYISVVKKNLKLFPYIEEDITAGTTPMYIKWIGLTTDTPVIKGLIVNTLFSQCDDFTFEDACNVQKILQKLGLFITETPSDIIETIAAVCQIKTVRTEPKLVTSIVKNRVTAYNRPLKDTVFKNLEIVNSLLKFMQRDISFDASIHGLPLCVTNASKLGVFGFEKLFCSEYSDLLPGSANLFVHIDLVNLLSRSELFERQILKQFTVQDLCRLLPESYDKSLYCVGSCVVWKQNDITSIAPLRISKLFRFIRQSSINDPENSNQSVEQNFVRNIKLLEEWSFLPGKEKTATTDVYKLFPLKNAYLLLHPPRREDIQPLLSKLHISSLDTDVFAADPGADPGAEKLVTQLIASEHHPLRLLMCLLHNKSKFNNCRMTSQEALNMLRYFLQQFQVNRINRTAFELLKLLPLYETICGYFVSVSDNSFILPQHIPTAGLNEWANNSDKYLLKEIHSLRVLYQCLHLDFDNALTFYNKVIFPNINDMPQEHWLIHIDCIRKMIDLSKPLPQEQVKLMDQIARLPFIKISGSDYCVMRLYDGSHPVFKHMVESNMFLPQQFMTREWKTFMDRLGLIVQPSGTMFVSFAQTLEAKGALGLTRDLIEASHVLVKYLFEESLDTRTVESCCSIKFVVPYQVPCKMTNLCPSYCDNAKFICFANTCGSNVSDICWSTVPLVNNIPSSKIMKLLQIKMDPDLEAVIAHTKNVCRLLSEDFSQQTEKFPDKMIYLKPLYDFLRLRVSRLSKLSLQSTAFILIPNEAMVKPSMIFISSSKSDEIRPFLFQAPKDLSSYFELFETIGSSPEVSCSQYASVLEAIYTRYPATQLPPNILICVSKAINNLFCILGLEYDDERTNLRHVSALYLPNTSRFMCRSDQLVLEDNKFYSEYLQTKRYINMFLSFKELNIKLSDPVGIFSMLPKHLQPRILSKEVSEQVSLSSIEEIPCSSAAIRFENFIHSFEFFEALCRILHHQSKESSTGKLHVDVDESIVCKRLSQVRIKQVNGLKTVVFFNGEDLGCIDRDYHVCMMSTDGDNSKDEDCYHLFYQEGNESDTSYIIQEGVMDFLERITENKLSKASSQLLQQLLSYVGSHHELSNFLDRKRVTAYQCNDEFFLSVCPQLGAYVDKKFYPFMVQTIAPFKEHEYRFVAMELEIDDDNEAKYVYVHIIQCVDTNDTSSLCIKYTVNGGSQLGTLGMVPIFRLFKFLPQTGSFSVDIGMYDDEPITSIPFEECCARVWKMLKEAFQRFTEKDRKRIIRRILLRCHPSGHANNDTVSREFHFILQSILRLENNMEEDVVIDNQTGRFRPDMFNSTYQKLCTDSEATGNYYCEEFRKNIAVYRKSRRHGTSFLALPEPGVVIAINAGEYKRWLKQAKLDFQTGRSHLLCDSSHPKTYNWICINFRQACENAIKAACFLQNRDYRRRNSLVTMATLLTNNTILAEASKFEQRIGSVRLLFPDSMHSNIPSEMVSKTDAELALDIAKNIIDEVNAINCV